MSPMACKKKMWSKICINPFWQLVELGAKVKTTNSYVL
jgi:hypothetical protein